MNAYIQLTIAQLKLFMRNKTIIFWTTFFPLFLMIVLGLFLGGGGTTTIPMAWVDEDDSALSNEWYIDLEAMEAIDLEPMEDVQSATEILENGDISFAIHIPEGFGERMSAAIENGQDNIDVHVYYDEVNQAMVQLGMAVIEQAIDDFNKQALGFEPIVSIDEQGVQSRNLTYLDFLVPGIAALMILSSGLNGVAAQIASWRERGVLRRLQSTPLAPGTFIAAQITARLLLNGSQALLVLLVGIFILQTQMNGNWLYLLAYLILGNLVFMAIGFIIANMAKTPEHASPIAGFVTFPMLFLGGIFFPISNMPDAVQPIVYAIPISHLTDALRQVMNLGATPVDLWIPTLVLGAWFIGSFSIASWLFRWE